MAIAGKKLRRSASKSASRNLLTLRLVEWLEGEDPSGCAELDKTLLIKCGRGAKRSRRGRWPPVPWLVVATQALLLQLEELWELLGDAVRKSFSLTRISPARAEFGPISSRAISRCRLEVTPRADRSLALTACGSGARRHLRVLTDWGLHKAQK